MSEDIPSYPPVRKVVELKAMIEMVESGLWQTGNLVKALHVNEDTIVEWKKRPEVQEAHRLAIMKWVKKRKDAEIALREMGMDTPQEAPKTLIQVNYQPIFSGESLHALPASNSDQEDIQPEKEN